MVLIPIMVSQVWEAPRSPTPASMRETKKALPNVQINRLTRRTLGQAGPNPSRPPVMTDVAVRFEFNAVAVEQGEPVNRLYPRHVGDLFEGEQLVLVGRYKKAGRPR